MFFSINGKVIEQETRVGVPGLLIKAIDKDLLFDDLIGTVFTGEGGKFSLVFEQEDFSEFFEKRPDIFIKVKTPDRSRILFSSEKEIRWNVNEEEYFLIEISKKVLGNLSPTKENNMENEKKIGTITLDIDPRQVEKIVNSGNLAKFVTQATELFARDLKTKLVEESVSSVSTSLAYFEDDDRYGTGPRPPFWHNLAEINQLNERISAIEKIIIPLEGKDFTNIARG